MRDFSMNIQKMLIDNTSLEESETPIQEADLFDPSKNVVLWMLRSVSGKLLLKNLLNKDSAVSFRNIFGSLSQVDLKKAPQVLFESPIVQQMIHMGDLEPNLFLWAEVESSYDNLLGVGSLLTYFLDQPLCSPYSLNAKIYSATHSGSELILAKKRLIWSKQREALRKYEENSLLVSLKNVPVLPIKNDFFEPNQVGSSFFLFGVAHALSECIEKSLTTFPYSLTLASSEHETYAPLIYTHLGVYANFLMFASKDDLVNWSRTFLEQVAKTAVCYLVDNNFLPPTILIPFIERFHARVVDFQDDYDKEDYSHLIESLFKLDIWDTLTDVKRFIAKKGAEEDLADGRGIIIEDDLLKRVSDAYRYYLAKKHVLKNIKLEENYSLLSYFLEDVIENPTKVHHAKHFISRCENAVDGLAVLKDYFDKNREKLTYIKPGKLVYTDHELPTSLLELLVCNPLTLQSLFGFSFNIKNDDEADNAVFEFIQEEGILSGLLAIGNLQGSDYSDHFHAAYNRLLYRPGSLLFWLFFLRQNTDDGVKKLHEKLIQYVGDNKILLTYVSLAQVLRDFQNSKDQDTAQLAFGFLEKYLETQVKMRQDDAYWQTVCYCNKEKLFESRYSPEKFLSRKHPECERWWKSLENIANKRAAAYFFRNSSFPLLPQEIEDHVRSIIHIVQNFSPLPSVKQKQIMESDNALITALILLGEAGKKALFFKQLLYSPEILKSFVNNTSDLITILELLPIENRKTFIMTLNEKLNDSILNKDQLISVLNNVLSENQSNCLISLVPAFQRLIQTKEDLVFILKELSVNNQFLFVKGLDKSFLSSFIQDANQFVFVFKELVAECSQQALISALSKTFIPTFIGNTCQFISVLSQLPSTHWPILIRNLDKFIHEHIILSFSELIEVLSALPTEAWPGLLSLLSSLNQDINQNDYYFFHALTVLPLESWLRLIRSLNDPMKDVTSKDQQLIYVLTSVLQELPPENRSQFLRGLGSILLHIIKNGEDLAFILRELSTENQSVLLNDLTMPVLRSLIQNEYQLAVVLEALVTENQQEFLRTLGEVYVRSLIQNEKQFVLIFKKLSTKINRQALVNILDRESIQGFIHNTNQLIYALEQLPLTHWSLLIEVLGNNIQEHLIPTFCELIDILRALPAEVWSDLINLLKQPIQQHVIRTYYSLLHILKALPSTEWPNFIRPLNNIILSIIEGPDSLTYILQGLPAENRLEFLLSLDDSIQQIISNTAGLASVLMLLPTEEDQGVFITALGASLSSFIQDESDLVSVLNVLLRGNWPVLFITLEGSLSNIIQNRQQLIIFLEQFPEQENRRFLITTLSRHIKELIPNNSVLGSLSKNHRNLYNDIKRELGGQIDARARYQSIWQQKVTPRQLESDNGLKARLVLSNYLLGGSMSRFFAGHWNRTREHLHAVAFALAEIPETSPEHTPQGFIRKIQAILSDQNINILEREGSLHRRLVYLADLEGKKLAEIILNNPSADLGLEAQSNLEV